MAKRIVILFYMAVSFVVAAHAQIIEFSEHISSNSINDFAEDSQGFIWMGTTNGLNRYNGATYMMLHAHGGTKNLDVDNILSVMSDSQGDLWLGTECGIRVMRNGVLSYDRWTETIYNPVTDIIEYDDESVIAMGRQGIVRFRKSDISFMGRYYRNGVSYLDDLEVCSNKEIWFSHDSRDSTFVRAVDEYMNEVFCRYMGQNVDVYDIVELPDASVLVAASSELRRYMGKYEIPLPEGLAAGLKDRKIHFILPYRAGLLFGCADFGFLYWDAKADSFTILVKEQKLEADNYICHIDSKENIWLSDGNSGFNIYTARPQYSFLDLGGEASDEITDIVFDHEGDMWAVVAGRVTGTDVNTGQIFYKDMDNIVSIQMDVEGRLTVASDEGVGVYSIEGRRLVKKAFYESSRNIFGHVIDKNGRIWVTLAHDIGYVSDDGEIVVSDTPPNFNYLWSDPRTYRIFLHTIDRGTYEFGTDGSLRQFRRTTVIGNSEDDSADISEKDVSNVSCICVASDSTVWFGTYNRGLIHYDENEDSTEVFNVEEGLIASNIRSIIEDGHGNLWLSTTTNVIKYDIQSKEFITIFDRYYSEGNSYGLDVVAAGPDGKIYFGGGGHITILDPDMEFRRKTDIPLYFESVMVRNETYPVSTGKLDLSHNENLMSFRFAGLDFESGPLLNYAYMMEGFDDDWHYVADNANVSYSYLPAGKYVFRVKVREQSGGWSSHELSLPVTVRPAPWASWWAKLSYILFGLMMLFIAVKVIIQFRTQKERVMLAERREDMKQEQIDFFTNISHEFRTPLSLIYAPAKQLAGLDLDGEARPLVDSILRNSERLQNISGQILDANPENHRENRLKVYKGDVIDVVRSVMDNFRYAALEKSIVVHLSSPDSVEGWFDADKITKIFSNLLSNGIKYTPYGRSIEVLVFSDRGGGRL